MGELYRIDNVTERNELAFFFVLCEMGIELDLVVMEAFRTKPLQEKNMPVVCGQAENKR